MKQVLWFVCGAVSSGGHWQPPVSRERDRVRVQIVEAQPAVGGAQGPRQLIETWMAEHRVAWRARVSQLGQETLLIDTPGGQAAPMSITIGSIARSRNQLSTTSYALASSAAGRVAVCSQRRVLGLSANQ